MTGWKTSLTFWRLFKVSLEIWGPGGASRQDVALTGARPLRITVWIDEAGDWAEGSPPHLLTSSPHSPVWLLTSTQSDQSHFINSSSLSNRGWRISSLSQFESLQRTERWTGLWFWSYQHNPCLLLLLASFGLWRDAGSYMGDLLSRSPLEGSWDAFHLVVNLTSLNSSSFCRLLICQTQKLLWIWRWIVMNWIIIFKMM